MLESKNIINMEGEKRNYLFHQIIKKIVNNENFHNIQERLDHYSEKYKKVSDDRALAIIAALSIEHELDKFLAAWIKGYKHILEKKELTFSFKVELAISAKFIPKKIFNAIEPIRQIRNTFAHHLDIDTFEKAKIYSPKHFKNIHNKVKSFIQYDIEDDKEKFYTLLALIVLGLNVYTRHIVKVQDYIWDSKNLIDIMNQ